MKAKFLKGLEKVAAAALLLFITAIITTVCANLAATIHPLCGAE